jgi:Holliday junction resolvase RusA-like endonuclease
MSRIISFFVPGIPSPGGSKQVFIPHRKGESPSQAIARGQRPIVSDMGGAKTRNWRNSVQHAAAEVMRAQPELMAGPLTLHIRFCMPRPKYHFNSKGVLRPGAPYYHVTSPDVTKLIRSTEDAMKQIVWRDDSQVALQIASKTYEPKAGAYIVVEEAAVLVPMDITLDQPMML